MRKFESYFGVAGLAALCLGACTPPSPAPDTPPTPDALSLDQPVHIFTADQIYTGNPADPNIGALIVGEDGRILMTLPVGADDNIDAPDITRTHFNGVIFPGFVDGHAHLRGIGERERTINLDQTGSIADMVASLANIVADKAPGDVISGRGWIETDWPEGRMPNAADLDSAAPDNPVIYVRADGHALVANSAAMDAVGINNDTPNPDGGAIERDETGAATGIFIDKAMGLIAAQIDRPTEADLRLALQTGAEVYASRGWTGLHNMSVGPAEAPLMAALSVDGKLPQRIHNSFDASGFEIAQTRQYETGTITNRAVKIYMDGALGSRGALLFEPYSDRPETSGLALRGQAETVGLMQRAHAANVQIALHAIGDKANSDALDWMQIAAGNDDTLRAARWRIEHAQILAPDQIARFGETGVIASMQPSHAIGDLKFAPDRLGADRLPGAYAWQSVLDTGGLIVGGSDAPVEVGSPLIEFYAAIARKTLEGESGPDWHAEQAVSRTDALAMFTTGPAYASFQEDRLGTLEVGKIADLSVFDRDLMTVPEADIPGAHAVATVLAGQIVWQAG